MLGPAGNAKLAIGKDDVRSKTVIDAGRQQSFGESRDHPGFTCVCTWRSHRDVGVAMACKTTLLKLLTAKSARSGKVIQAKTLSGIVMTSNAS